MRPKKDASKPKKVESHGDTKSNADLSRAKRYGLTPKRTAALKVGSSPPKTEAKGDQKSNEELRGRARKAGRAAREVRDTKSNRDLHRRSGPAADIIGKHDLDRAEVYKLTPAYRAAVRAAYHGLSDDDRRVTVAKALADYNLSVAGRKKLSPESRTILLEHGARHERGLDATADKAQHDVDYDDKGGYKPTHAEMRDINWRRKNLQHKPASKNDILNIVDPIHSIRLAGGIAESAAATGVAAYHDPVGVPVKTGKQLLRSLPAVPGGIAHTVAHPKAAAKEFSEGMETRSEEDFSKRVKTIRKEGALDYLSDVAAFTPAVGAGAVKAIRLAARVPSGERAAVRLSGDTLKERRSRETISDAVGRLADNRRAAKHKKRLHEAEDGVRDIDVLEAQAAKANREAGRVVEVVGRGVNTRVGRLVAKQRSRGVYGLNRDQTERVGAARKTINRLSKKEKRALWYAATLGIRTPQHAEEILPQLRDLIHENRGNKKIKGRLKRSDMLPDIEAMLSKPDDYFTENLVDTVEALRHDSERAAAEDPSLTDETAERRRHLPLRDVLGMERGYKPHVDSHGVPGLRYHADETDADFTRRIAAEADRRGLGKPLYFRSERYADDPGYGDFTVGGIRGIRRDRAYEGTNLKQGLQDTSERVYLHGLARNIKRKHNWNLVADILDTHAVKEITHDPAGGKVSDIFERLAEGGTDFQSVRLWNPGVYRMLAKHFDDKPSEDFDLPEEAEGENIVTAMKAATIKLDKNGRAEDGFGRTVDEAKLNESNGWHAMPAAAMKELEAQMQPSGKVARGFAIAKGKASRAILATANIPWLTFQAASNATMSTVASGGRVLNPVNWVHAHRDWKEMSSATKQLVGGHYGLGATASDAKQIRMGATTNSKFANAYRAFKAHPFWHTGIAHGHGPSISDLNPLELMIRADVGQTNAFRILTGYTHAKREAIRRMGEGMSQADRAQLAITNVFKRPPAEQLAELRANPRMLDEHGEAIDKWMGDYTTMTAAERKSLNQVAMFYPYLRYSLRLLFYTLPVKHPVVTSVLAELGNLHADELEKLFGSKSLPWNAGKIYFDDGKLSIDLKRMNPVLNAPIEAISHGQPSQLIGMLPPYAGWLLDQAYKTNSFSGKDWRVHGEAGPYPDPTIEDRGRVALDDILSLTFPYRTAEKLTQSGIQGDDSLLWSQRPIEFKGKTSYSKLQKKFGNRRERFEEENEDLIHELIPLLPEPDRSVKQKREDEILARAEPKPGKKRKRGGYFGASGGTGTRRKGYFGASR